MNALIVDLRRITSGGKFIPEIDGLRFIAIASVVFFHLQWLLSTRVSGAIAIPDNLLTYGIGHGYRGVSLFFVISGFILGMPFAAHNLKGRKKVDIRQYFLRRITRLEPPYVLNLLICFTLLTVLKHQSHLLPHLGASLVYMHNVMYGKTSLINGVAWSLEVEIQFYCLAPLLSTVFAISSKWTRRTILVVVICVALTLQIKFPNGPQLTILYYVQYFLAGFLLIDLYITDWNEDPQSAWLWDILSLVGWPLLFIAGEGFMRFASVPVTFIVYCATFRGVIFRKVLASPIITAIGGMCYTIYLFHQPIISLLIGRSGHIYSHGSYYSYFAIQAFLVGLAVIPISILFFIFIERPCMKRDWPQQLMQGFLPMETAVAASLEE